MAESRRAWACPDLGKPRPEGRYLPIPGSTFEFSTCPAGYLRSGADGLPAPHLLHGATTHPFEHVAEAAAELEAGAVVHADLPAKVVDLVQIYRRERSAKYDYEREVRKENARNPMHRVNP